MGRGRSYSRRHPRCGSQHGGWGGIRTHGGREPTPVFKTGALNHSATHPLGGSNYSGCRPIANESRTDIRQQPRGARSVFTLERYFLWLVASYNERRQRRMPKYILPSSRRSFRTASTQPCLCSFRALDMVAINRRSERWAGTPNGGENKYVASKAGARPSLVGS